MVKRPILWHLLAATLALPACGGGSDSTGSGGTPATPDTPTGSTIDRIEPLDTAMMKSAAAPAPAARSRLPAAASVPRVALGPLVKTKTLAAPGKGAALQIGQARALTETASAADLAARLRWSVLDDGARVAALAFSAEGAQAIRLGVLVRQLPPGAVLRFYGDGEASVVEMPAAELQALRLRNQASGLTGDAADMAWGPDTAGSVSTLEVQIPAGASPSQVQLAVPQLSHLTQTVAQAARLQKNTAQIGEAGQCNLDVMCAPDLQSVSRAVAKMMITDGGDTYLCTGTLLNDTRSSLTPYFLTVDHCVSGQAAASTVVTYWFFRAAACDSSPRYDPAMKRLGGGARLLYVDPASVTTLLRLNAQPPAGVVYAGSYFGPDTTAGTPVEGVHHPYGDLQKYSEGAITGYANCGSSTCGSAGAGDAGMYEVHWTQGITEAGSSGSAIFSATAGTRYVVGVLYGGNASCQNQNGADYYGRFDRAAHDGVSNWLVQ